MPIATAPPVFEPPGPLDEVFAETLVSLVALAVGFSVGIEGMGEVGLPVADELTGGAGGDIDGGVDEVDGTDGGGEGNVGIGGGGEFVFGGGLSD
jgi:hypothetical protein